jgi:hypothetical protein
LLDRADYVLTLARLWVLDRRTPPQETLVDRAIREEGERLRKAFPWLDKQAPKQVSLANQDDDLASTNLPSSPAIASAIGRLLSSNFRARSSPPPRPERQELQRVSDAGPLTSYQPVPRAGV